MAKGASTEGYISRASLREVRVAPRKARLVVNMIRGQQVERALDMLEVCDKKTAPMLKKLLLSAVANADRSDVDIDELYVKRIWVDEGKTLHRIMPRARGSAAPIRKRHSSITVLLDEVGA
ncbi:MAG: 50S ribosomal protein L22 [Bdellovibrionales bacterium]|nr:50S ribosomal protein L22 [Bdellovibrionales bacterium]